MTEAEKERFASTIERWLSIEIEDTMVDKK